MDETNFRDSNSFLIDGKSFVVRYFPTSETSILVRTNSVPLTSEEQAISTSNPDSVTTGGGLNYGDIAAGGVALQGGVAPEAFKNQYANDPQLQQTIENATRSVTGPIPLEVIPAPPSSPEQGGSTTINPAPTGTPQQPDPVYLMYPRDMKPSQDRIMFEAYEYKSGFERLPGATNNAFVTKLNPVTYVKIVDSKPVILPIQSSIVDQNSVGWESDTMNPIEIAAANLSKAAMTTVNTPDDLGTLGANFLNSAIIQSKNADYGPALRAYFIGQAVGVNNLQSRVLGQVLNPNLELLFQGPQLRPFNFTFKMSARNRREAVEIKQIIKYFKKNMAAKEGDSVFLKAPNVFKIQYQLNGNPHPGLNLIKMCALTNCSVDYTPLGSYATYNDGTMVAYSMSLSFQELTPIYDTDYDDNTEPAFDYGSAAGKVPLEYYTKNNGIGP
jgi:hypothetical protein